MVYELITKGYTKSRTNRLQNLNSFLLGDFQPADSIPISDINFDRINELLAGLLIIDPLNQSVIMESISVI